KCSYRYKCRNVRNALKMQDCRAWRTQNRLGETATHVVLAPLACHKESSTVVRGVGEPAQCGAALLTCSIAHVRDRVGCAGAQGSSAEFDRATFLQSSKVATAVCPL